MPWAKLREILRTPVAAKGVTPLPAPPQAPRGTPLLPPGLLLAVTVVAFSTSAILIRLATAGAFVIALWRLALPVLPGTWIITKRRMDWPQGGRQWLLASVSALCLAVHFGTWIPALRLTTIAQAMILVQMYPLPILLVERVQGVRQSTWGLTGAGVAIVGVVLIALSAHGGRQQLLGDGLALIAALAGAAYFLIGRHLRQEMDVLPYTTVVYGLASLALLVAALVTGQSLLNLGLRNWLLILALAVVPTTLGHTLSNYLLRWVNASTVAVVGLLEAVGATLIAIPVFGQQPTWLVAAGGLLALGGAALFLIHRPRPALPLP
ncbi:MAG: DMT family transporter [Sulfobacillus sp.]